MPQLGVETGDIGFRWQVVLVELCKDRLGLMLNPDGPVGVQLWNSRQLMLTGLPGADGWPCQEEILSGSLQSACTGSCK